MYDLIIIGAGPAGITAAIYAARRKVKFLIIGMDVGGQVNWSSDVDNYPGIRDSTGIELTKKFYDHLNDYNIKIKQEEIIDVNKKGKIILVKTHKNVYETKTVIIASGKKPKKLEIKGEEEFLGRGVSYCATCDAPFYENKTVAVIGGGNSALEASLHLSKYAKKIYLMDINDKLGGEAYLKNKVLDEKKIIYINNMKLKEILGDKIVKELVYEREGVKKLKIDGIFIEIGLVSRSEFIKIVKKNKWGEIMIFRSTLSNEENLTSIPGIFAGGDVTDIPAKQIVVAAGEGCKAALAAFDYINKWK